MKALVIICMYTLGLMGGTGEDGKKGDKEPGNDSRSYKKGMIVNLGNGGDMPCGWVIEIEGKKYKPKNMSKAFQKDSLVVKLDFENSLSVFKCDQLREDGAQEIYINWMEKSK